MDGRSIPHILHQTWKSKKLPRSLARFRQSWLNTHPGWEHRLWTDEDNRAFLQKYYAWFLPVYDGYDKTIMRVDAIRYFFLYHFGGVYADLDLECLRPIEPLLENKQVIIGCEPPEHLTDYEGVGGNSRILCNAFMASVPKHGFWEYVIHALPSCCDVSDPLSATGPFFLTKVGEAYEDKQLLSIESHETLYPLDKNKTGGRRRVQPALDHAYTIHHWRGSWWTPAGSPTAIANNAMKRATELSARLLTEIKPWLRRAYLLIHPDRAFRYLLHLTVSASSRLTFVNDDIPSGQIGVAKVSGGVCIARVSVDKLAAQAALEKSGCPLVSCLMVTRERLALAQRAIQCFRRQTYPNRELVVIDDDPSDELKHWIDALQDPQIRHVRLSGNKTLGELRQISMREARGEYVAVWDDDDIYHPERLQMQMLSISTLSVDACFLHRHLLWSPERRYLCISAYRLCEGTMVAKKEKLSAYQALDKGEDTLLCHELIKKSDIALCDGPGLYIYVFHGRNTWGTTHFKKIFHHASREYTGSEYDRALIDLQKKFGCTLDQHAPAFADVAQQIKNSSGENSSGNKVPTSTSSGPASSGNGTDRTPHILVLTPVKNATPHLQRFVENLNASTYPKNKISLAFLESDSDDGTYEELEKVLPLLRERYVRAELFKRDFGYRPSRPRWDISEQFTRRSILARSRNLLMNLALRDEDWVLWMDIDLLRWPADAIERLLSPGEDIIVPHCVKPDGNTFDLNTFVLDENADQLNWERYVCDGILQPPIGFGRRYLGEFTGHERVEVDGVGGTMLLVRADIHRQGLVYPACAFDFYIETEGLARMAKGMGYSPCGLPDLTIVHS